MLLKEKEEIIDWLDKYNIQNYTLRPDEAYGYVVDVTGNVSLWRKNLTEICVKFGKVTGDFNCSYNQLTSLEGSPVHVEEDFYCADNQLTSLHGCPHTVGGHFYCNSNKLISLEGMPESIGGYFYCRGNPGLGELQKVSFKEIKAYLLSKKLAMELAHDLDKNNRKIKL